MSVSAVGNAQLATSNGSSGADYTVKSGDTLWDIAQAHGVSLQALEAANPQIANPDLIFPGQHVNIPSGGSASGVGGTGGVSGSPGGGTGNVFDIAKSYLGQNASDLKVNTHDQLNMDPNVSSDECCANFVSGVLQQAGQLSSGEHTNGVAELNTELRNKGWTPVSAADAKPGDVVIIQGGGISHTEIYAGDGKMIGSNNDNPDGSQKVTYNNFSWAQQHGAVILRAPASASSGGSAGTSGSSGTQGTGAANPSGQGDHTQLINQAMSYFESQGWTKAQAAGIVANLDAESGMRAGIQQYGGGPGYGLAQWEGPRQAAFAQWAGHDIHGSSFAEQLRFVQYELTHSESGAGNALKQATDARSAGSIVCSQYERPADTAGQSVSRGNRAVDIFNGQ